MSRAAGAGLSIALFVLLGIGTVALLEDLGAA